MATKRQFSLTERKCFIDILKKYRNIVDNKKSDGAYLALKNKTWDRITSEYNASSLITHQLTHKQLRRLWTNIKHRHRGALTKARQYRLATGSGPPTKDLELDPEVLIAPSLIVGVENGIDSDSGFDGSGEKFSEVVVKVEEQNQDEGSPQESDPLLQHDPVSTTQIGYNLQPTNHPSPILSTPPSSTQRSTSSPTPLVPTLSRRLTARRLKATILEKEYLDRCKRANEKQEIEILILKEQLEEAKVKTAIAKLVFAQQQRQYPDQPLE